MTAITAPPTPVSPNRVRTRGFFDEGVWKCNCEPRRPAVHFETRNGGKNHGRWFYTCQESPPRRCDFFLWDDDAKLREKKAVLSNSHTEPGSTQLKQAQLQSPQRPQYQQQRQPQLQQTQLQFDGNHLLQSTQQPSHRRRNSRPSSSQNPIGQEAHDSNPEDSKPKMPSAGAAAAVLDGRRTPPSQFYSWPSSDVDETQDFDERAVVSFGSDMSSGDQRQTGRPEPTTPRKRHRGEFDKDDDGYSYRPTHNDQQSQNRAHAISNRVASPSPHDRRQPAPRSPPAIKKEPNADQVPNQPGLPDSYGGRSSGTLIPANTGIATPEVTPANPTRTYDALNNPSSQSRNHLTGMPSTPTVSAANLRLQQQQQHQQGPPTPSKTPNGSSVISNLPDDVFGLLQTSSITLPPDTSSALRDLCNRHVLLARGIEKGRETVRDAVRDRETTIAELRQTITSLEERNASLEEDLQTVKRARKSESASAGVSGRPVGRGGRGGVGAAAAAGGGSLAATSYDPSSSSSRMYTAAEELWNRGRQVAREEEEEEELARDDSTSVTSSDEE